MQTKFKRQLMTNWMGNAPHPTNGRHLLASDQIRKLKYQVVHVKILEVVREEEGEVAVIAVVTVVVVDRDRKATEEIDPTDLDKIETGTSNEGGTPRSTRHSMMQRKQPRQLKSNNPHQHQLGGNKGV